MFKQLTILNDFINCFDVLNQIFINYVADNCLFKHSFCALTIFNEQTEKLMLINVSYTSFVDKYCVF